MESQDHSNIWAITATDIRQSKKNSSKLQTGHLPLLEAPKAPKDKESTVKAWLKRNSEYVGAILGERKGR